MLNDPARWLSPGADDAEALRQLHAGDHNLPTSYHYADKGKWRSNRADSDYAASEDEEEAQDEGEEELANDEIDQAVVAMGDALPDEMHDEEGMETEGLEPGSEDEQVHLRPRDNWPIKSGALTKEESELCKVFGREVLAEADALGKKLKKKRRTILLEAGLMIQSGRLPNLSNQYRAWYATVQPKTDNGIYPLFVALRCVLIGSRYLL